MRKQTRPCARCGGTKFVELKPGQDLSIDPQDERRPRDPRDVPFVFVTCLGCAVTEMFASLPAEKLAKYGEVFEVAAGEGPYR